MKRAQKTSKGYTEPPPFVWYKSSDELKMKCLLCSKILQNPGSYRCKAFNDKPDDIYYENANCPHFERTTNDEALRWIEAYVNDYLGYIPREDDTPPPGWEKINLRKCGPNWRSITEQTYKRFEELKQGLY